MTNSDVAAFAEDDGVRDSFLLESDQILSFHGLQFAGSASIVFQIALAARFDDRCVNRWTAMVVLSCLLFLSSEQVLHASYERKCKGS